LIYGLYNSAAGMMVNQYRQDVLANNLANAETVGFSRDVAVFAERRPASAAGRRSGPSAADMAGLSGGLWLGKTHTDFTIGNVYETGRALDVALDAPGFFAVRKGGDTLFTRDGRFTTNAAGQLVAASDGAPVLGRGGVPIVLNPYGSRPSVDQLGRIWQDGGLVGALEIADFTDYAALRKVGASRVDASATQPKASYALVKNGVLEESGVEPIVELTDMIEASRAYQMNAAVLTLQDQSIGRLINIVSRA
jgi:flagellar basal-body rod protein FlgG